MVQEVLQMRNTVLAALQQHKEAYATIQAELSQAAGSPSPSVATQCNHLHGCGVAMSQSSNRHEAHCSAGAGSSNVSESSYTELGPLQKKRKRDDDDVSDGKM